MHREYTALLKLVQKNLQRFPPPDRDLTDDPLESIVQAVLYLRLSKEEKERKRLNGIDVQRQSTHEFCQRMGWSILEEFVDEGISGKSFTERPAWDSLVAYVGRLGEAARNRTAIVFATVDRFGRHVGEMEMTREQLEGTGIRLRFADNLYLFPETLEGFQQYIFLAVFATIERLFIVKRTKAALKERKRRGIHLGEFPKLGFVKDEEKRIVPDEVAEEVVRLRIAGESYGAIGLQLGIDKRDAHHIASFLRREVERGQLQEAST